MDSSSATARRPYFIEEDDGLLSFVDMEAGFSGSNHSSFFSRPKNLSLSSPRTSARFPDHRHHRFLDSCFLCRKPLANNRDIFMYRGDTPFCSEECRQQQIEMDEAMEKKRSMSSSFKAMRKKDQKKSSSPAGEAAAGDCRYRTSTLAAA